MKNIGPLWACSCFWFEDFNGDLRTLFHGTNKVELQIAFSVCVQQKIPELIPLLQHGSASKEFYQHMTEGRYSLKCKREEISTNVFALGIMSPASLSARLKQYVESKLCAQISKAFTFKRIQINRDVTHSKAYVNTTRRNSCTVYVNDVGFVEVKLYVKVFPQCRNAIYFVLIHAAAKCHNIMELLTAIYSQKLILMYLLTISLTVTRNILFLLGKRNVVM